MIASRLGLFTPRTIMNFRTALAVPALAALRIVCQVEGVTQVKNEIVIRP
jgi:hypothetical protein